MVNQNTPDKKPPLYFKISETGADYRLDAGDISVHGFLANQTLLIPKHNIKAFWVLLQNLTGIPLETKEPPMETSISGQHMDLGSLSGRQIIEKVRQDTGITITISPKSKAAIVKKAFEIYAGKK